jgi:predicted RNA binding protein YcfA (HicA-like mRNA interferase family)
MRAITGKELSRILEKHGWSVLRVKGSHHIYGKSGSKARLSVPVHGSRALKTGLARHLLKLAGLSESDL